jgi:hypothetical protein
MLRILLALVLSIIIAQARAASCTPSPNGTMIPNGSSVALLDQQCNKWTVAGGVVSENGTLAGYTANVIELAIVNTPTGQELWQLNTTGQWWGSLPQLWVGPVMASPLPTVSPVPAAGLTAAQQAAVALVTADLAKLLADAATDGDDLTKYQTDYAAMLTALGVAP